jgi:hypothetical protein
VWLVAGSGSGGLRVYDPEAGTTLHRLQGHPWGVTGVLCYESPPPESTPRAVTVSQEGKVWGLEEGNLEALLESRPPGMCIAVAIYQVSIVDVCSGPAGNSRKDHR